MFRAITACFLALAFAQVAAGQVIENNNPYSLINPTVVSPYWGYSYNPYAGYLTGGASVIQAQGQFMLNKQQARILNEMVNQAKIDTRRKQLDQWLWERQNLPTPQDERERLMNEELRRSRNDPPITEIWSGKALNDLLRDANKIQSSVPSGAKALNEDMLAKVNVTTGKAGGNVGIIKSGQIAWPLLLRRRDFAEDRQLLDRLVADAIQQVVRGQVDAGTLEEIIRKASEMQKTLTNFARKAGDQATWTPTMFMDAKHFLEQFDAATRVLEQPNAAQYFNGAYAAKGKNVKELVDHMKNNGLTFAPATAGSEGAYSALYQALRDYDVEGGAPSIKTK